MKLKAYFATLVLLLLFAGAVFAAPPESCKNGKWIGSYTRTDEIEVSAGVFKTFVNQYNFNADGTVVNSFSGANEQPHTTGSTSPFFGSWVCRNDGHIVTTILGALYGGSDTDTELFVHVRITAEYVVVDKNTLKRIKSRSRSYDPSEDPGDPNAGTLGTISTFERILNRISADPNELNP